MTNIPISIFISYSRTDSSFVDRLEADLLARNFRTWVDRRKLEGGRNWMDELEDAIDHSDVLLVVLSPDAVVSEYVKMEYRFAKGQGKQIIPLEFRTCPRVPIDLNSIQWVSFKSIYDQGLKDLLIALSHLEAKSNAIPTSTASQKTATIATRINLTSEEPALVVPQPAPTPLDRDLNDLYRIGITARTEGNLERSAVVWQQILDREPNFGNGILAPQMQKLLQELHPLRVQRLRDQAEQSHRVGAWGQEIGAWKALLGFEPNDAQAIERISIAEHNQKYVWLYENAQQFINEGEISSARTQLNMLWEEAKYYGDPAGLARYVGTPSPMGYEAEKTIRFKKIREAEAKKVWERRLRSIFPILPFVSIASTAFMIFLIYNSIRYQVNLNYWFYLLTITPIIIFFLSIYLKYLNKRR